MSKYDTLWEYVRESRTEALTLTFDQIEEISGVKIDHSFLNYKKELLSYGYQVGKISLKEKLVNFSRT